MNGHTSKSLRSGLGRVVLLASCSLAIVGGVWWGFSNRERGFQERLLSRAPSNADLDRIAFSAEGDEAAYVIRENNRESVVAGSFKSPQFDEIAGLTYAPARGTAAIYYAGRTGQTWTLMAKDRIVAKADRFPRLFFADKGADVAYVAAEGSKVRVENGPEKGPLVDEIGELVFDPKENRRFVYSAREAGHWHVVAGQRSTADWDAIAGLAYDNDGKEVIYSARLGAEWYLVLGESKLGPFDAVEAIAGHGAPRQMAYIARSRGHAKLFEGARLVDEVDGDISPVRNGHIVVGFVRRTQPGKSTVRLAGRTTDLVEDVNGQIISADGNHRAYSAATSSGVHVVADGVESSFEAEDISDIQITARGSVVYKARVGPEDFVRTEGAGWSLLDLKQLTPLKVNQSGSRVAFGARRENELWWKVFDLKGKSGAIPDAAEKFDHWQIVGRGKSQPGVEFVDGGSVTLKGHTTQFTAPPEASRILLSPRSPDAGHFLVSTSLARSASLWVVSVQNGRSVPIKSIRPALPIQRLYWAASGRAALITTARDTYWIDAGSGEAGKVQLGLPKSVSFRDIDAATWDHDDRLVLSVSGWCTRDDDFDQCGVKMTPRRYQVVLTGPALGQTRTTRVDVQSPTGAEDAVSGYIASIKKGDIDAALKLVDNPVNRKDRETALAMAVFRPLARSIGSRTTISVPVLTVDSSYAVATANVTGPDFRNTPQGERFANDVMGWMLTSGLQALASQNDKGADEQQLLSLKPIVERFAESVVDAPAPSMTSTTKCPLVREDGKWLLSSSCETLRFADVAGVTLQQKGRSGTSYFPELAEAVNDFAGVVDTANGAEMDFQIGSLFKRTGGDSVVVVSLETCAPFLDLRECSMRLFENHGRGIGQAGKDNGVLILLALRERQVRITTGYGMEAIIPDGLAAEISRAMAPSFMRQQYAAGLRVGVERVVETIRRARGVIE